MNFVPGEPVPPGFEDEVRQIPEIQDAIDNYQGGPLVGLEYTVELYSEETKEPSYHCLLCDKRGDPRTIFAHWISYNHRLKFLEKHYGQVIREIAPHRYPDVRNLIPTVVQKIATAIETHHGRLPPTVVESGDFKRNRSSVLDDIINSKHFDDRNGPNFVDLIDKDLLEGKKKKRDPSPPNVKAPKRVVKVVPGPIPTSVAESTKLRRNRNSLDSISSESDSGNAKGNASNGKKRKKSQSPAYKVLPRVRRSPPFEEIRDKDGDNNKSKALPTPKELSLQASQIAQEKYKWEKYRCMVEIAVKELENTLKEYEKNPEKHPLYPEEWKKFWNRRYKELQSQKKDPNKYDYKPEWIIFWTRRMKELHDEEVIKKKIEFKTKLGLPADGEEKTDQLKQQFKIQVAPVKNAKPTDKPPVIDISDDESLSDHGRRSPKKKTTNRSRSYSRSLSPLSDDYTESRRFRRGYERSRSRERYRERSRSRERLRERYPIPGHHVDYMYHPPGPRGFYPHAAPPPPPYGGGYRVMDPYKYPKYEAADSPKPVEPEEPENEEPLTVVAVLRLLTALEDYLGSLGPKVVDMLGKALALEKLKPNSSDDMLVNEDNCVFFETIKEKLKGQLIANVLDDAQKVKAVKKAIRNIAGIIHQVNTKELEKTIKEKEDEDTNDDKPKAAPKPAKTAKDLPFDRQIVSTKLAAALVMQGMEDVTTNEMDKLIYLYILMVKISKGSDEPIQTNDFAEEIGIPVDAPPSVAVVEEEEVEPVKPVVEEVEEPIELDEELDEKDLTAQSSASALESLTDSDLQTLLQNFKHLSSEEQHHLIAHLKKLETADPVRVEKLRKYVNISDDGKESSTGSQSKKSDSPVANSRPDTSPYQNNRRTYLSDDEDDDYNFEDVVKIASNNVKRQDSLSRDGGDNSNASKTNTLSQTNTTTNTTTANALPMSMQDTQNVIANLMGSLQKSNSTAQNANSTAMAQQRSGTNSLPFYQQQSSQQSYANYPVQQAQSYYNQYNPQQQQSMYDTNTFSMYGQNNMQQQQYPNYMGGQQQQPQPPTSQQTGYNNIFQRGRNM